MKKTKLDKYEQEIFDSYERGEWESVKNVKPYPLKTLKICRSLLFRRGCPIKH
jgi:hypothetical protein